MSYLDKRQHNFEMDSDDQFAAPPKRQNRTSYNISEQPLVSGSKQTESNF